MSSTDVEAGDWGRLASEVKARRQELQLSHSGVSRRGGPSHETVRLVERHGRDSFRDLTLDQLDQGLQWKPGIARRIVNGTAPADRDEWQAEMTPEEMTRRAVLLGGRPGPTGMSPLPMSLDNISDIELAGEMVSRITRGGTAAQNRRLLGELMSLLGRLSEDEAEGDARRPAS